MSSVRQFHRGMVFPFSVFHNNRGGRRQGDGMREEGGDWERKYGMLDAQLGCLVATRGRIQMTGDAVSCPAVLTLRKRSLGL